MSAEGAKAFEISADVIDKLGTTMAKGSPGKKTKMRN